MPRQPEIQPAANIVITSIGVNRYNVTINNELQQRVRGYNIYHHAGCRPVFEIRRDTGRVDETRLSFITTTTFYHIKQLRIEHDN